MSEQPPININLAGIESKWSKSGHALCAVCGRDFDNADAFSEEEQDNGDHVPLQLFRGTGKRTEMLTLCWKCAEPRMKTGEPEEPEPMIGRCCRCGKLKTLRTLAQLPYKGPTPGRGWGCMVCDLPPDGMVAIICDECAELPALEANLRWICSDYPSSTKRHSWANAKKHLVPHNHDLSKHPEITVNN